MRTILLSVFLIIGCTVGAQRNCASAEYLQEQKAYNPSLDHILSGVESFIKKQSSSLDSRNLRVDNYGVIRIPVVVHVLYNTADQNIPDAQIKSQLDVLNKDFRRLNADTANTPQRFKSIAADVEIEFYLATADPMGRATTGIVRKKTSVQGWGSTDKIKFNSEGGDNAWDSKSYLNIWVGNLKSALGYATSPGTDAAKDGLVINYAAYGTVNNEGPYSLGRTAVHEIGHWLGLKHIWGDTYCGDDGVSDTPPQSNFTPGCPTTFRTSCSNGSTGDMYMNYMDFTYDACINMFTKGQKSRMRALFNPGGPRASLLDSKGLNEPWLEEAPVSEIEVKEASLYPNPAGAETTVNFGVDDTWVGKELQLFNSHGILVQQVKVGSVTHKLQISGLRAGMYIIKGENGEKRFLQKLIKL